jgi:hypothetical protein
MAWTRPRLSEQLETGGDPDAAAVEIKAIKSQTEADVAAEKKRAAEAEDEASKVRGELRAARAEVEETAEAAAEAIAEMNKAQEQTRQAEEDKTAAEARAIEEVARVHREAEDQIRAAQAEADHAAGIRRISVTALTCELPLSGVLGLPPLIDRRRGPLSPMSVPLFQAPPIALDAITRLDAELSLRGRGKCP